MMPTANYRCPLSSFGPKQLPKAARQLREKWMQVKPRLLIAMFSLSLIVAAGVDDREYANGTQPAPQPESARAIEMRIPDTAHCKSPSATPNLDNAAASSWEGEAPSATVMGANAANYVIDWYSINAGGIVGAQSANYLMGASVAQPIAGTAMSDDYQMGIGFWYGAIAGTGTCACDCHADPVCDGVISNVQDVVGTIGVAFRGASAIPDPNGACPFETTDMNCDGFTSVVDVVKVVNVAFRGANASTEYCDPCP